MLRGAGAEGARVEYGAAEQCERWVGVVTRPIRARGMCRGPMRARGRGRAGCIQPWETAGVFTICLVNTGARHRSARRTVTFSD